MTRNRWRRTDLNGEIAPDDWTLLDPSGEPLLGVVQGITRALAKA